MLNSLCFLFIAYSILVSKDTDIFISITWAYHLQWLCNDVLHVWGRQICKCGFSFWFLEEWTIGTFSWTDYDAASYIYDIGKVKVFSKILKGTKTTNLLFEFPNSEPLATGNCYSVKKLLQTVMYNGKAR